MTPEDRRTAARVVLATVGTLAFIAIVWAIWGPNANRAGLAAAWGILEAATVLTVTVGRRICS